MRIKRPVVAGEQARHSARRLSAATIREEFEDSERANILEK